MEKIIVPSAVIIFAAVSLNVVQGLSCYSCYDIENVPQDALDYIGNLKHVNWIGKTECNRDEAIDGESDKRKVQEKCKNVTDSTGSVIQPVCMISNLTVKVPDNPAFTNLTGVFKLIVRGCFYADPAVANLTNDKVDEGKRECTQPSYDDLEQMAASSSPIKQLMNAIRPSSTASKISIPTLDFCHCNSDNCNPASLISIGKLPLITLLVAFLLGHLRI